MAKGLGHATFNQRPVFLSATQCTQTAPGLSIAISSRAQCPASQVGGNSFLAKHFDWRSRMNWNMLTRHADRHADKTCRTFNVSIHPQSSRSAYKSKLGVVFKSHLSFGIDNNAQGQALVLNSSTPYGPDGEHPESEGEELDPAPTKVREDGDTSQVLRCWEDPPCSAFEQSQIMQPPLLAPPLHRPARVLVPCVTKKTVVPHGASTMTTTASTAGSADVEDIGKTSTKEHSYASGTHEQCRLQVMLAKLNQRTQ
ncbi:hypothetical protein B0O80DRAFT_500251 [Mortierella sp. GBAus27b]|nr:hypothetical protein B0O80DRAFT_500251 [Mortierella sp. GBAus27b]